jgi:hypothetical protein
MQVGQIRLLSDIPWEYILQIVPANVSGKASALHLRHE